MDPRDVRELIVEDIHEKMFFLTAGYPMADTGDKFESLSELFQGLAICHLLVEANVDKFRENLVRSGHARRYFLRKSQEEGNNHDRHLALSRSEAFLDSVVAGDLGLARDIVRLSSEVWEKNWEYEDDFCFFLFLHTIVKNLDPFPALELRTILERFEQSLEGGFSTRLDVCKALVSQDEEEFANTLHVLLEEKQEQIDNERSSIMEDQFLFWPRSVVFVEGLALLKIAEIVGMQIDEEFPLCPQEARFPTVDKQYVDLFADLEHALAADREEPS